MRQYGDGPGALIFWLVVLFLPIVAWLWPDDKIKKMKREAALKDDDSIAGSIKHYDPDEDKGDGTI